MLADSLPDKKQLIVSGVDTLTYHRFIGFIFVKHLEFSPGKPDERIEPVQDGDDREQQHAAGRFQRMHECQPLRLPEL